MRIKLARWRIAIYLTAVLVTAVGVFARTPYSLLAPGRALDLRDVVNVTGHAPPSTHYYMTDVGVIEHVSPFGLLAALDPGSQLVQTSLLEPTDIDDATYDHFMGMAMDDSQSSAVFVAEGAAGMGKPAIPSGVRVLRIVPPSRAGKLLHAGDDLISVDGHKVESVAALQAVLETLAPGQRVAIVFNRLGNGHVRGNVPTISIGGKTRLGISLQEFSTFPDPPVKVRYNVGNIEGSSGGVMFALEIYRSFRPAKHSPALRIAGTGTIDIAGDVGEIAGTMQKLVAAQRAGATLFLVPAQNYADVRSVRGITIVPIRTFKDAIQATGGV